jgi:hypothetical protein
MKISVILIPLLVVFLSSCSSVRPYSFVETATLDCIDRASWEVAPSLDQGLMEELKRIRIVNTSAVPIYFEFRPWWDVVDRIMASPYPAVDPKDLPATYLTPGQSLAIRIIHPVFFGDGAYLLALRELTAKEVAGSVDARAYEDRGHVPFGHMHQFRIEAGDLKGRGVYKLELDLNKE